VVTGPPAGKCHKWLIFNDWRKQQHFWMKSNSCTSQGSFFDRKRKISISVAEAERTLTVRVAKKQTLETKGFWLSRLLQGLRYEPTFSQLINIPHPIWQLW
jgi:hypothetical protein